MSDLNELFWDAEIEQLKEGYVFENKHYTCLICKTAFEDGVVYQQDGALYEARKAVENHIVKQHESMFHYLLNLNKAYTGLSEVQRELLNLFHKGLSDKEIMNDLGKTSTSTIRNHRFKLKEKKKQAKVFLAIMELLEASEENNNTNSRNENSLVTVHKGATMIDDRYVITEKEEKAAISTYFDEHGSLKTMPRKEKRKIIVLKHIVKNFKEDKTYKEPEVNRVLKRIYNDYPTLRRYLIEYGFMERSRDCRSYWVK